MLHLMKDYSLARKISVFLLIKLFLLFILWKVCFSHPLSSMQREKRIDSYLHGEFS